MINKKIWLSSPHMGGMEEKYVNEAFGLNWIAPIGNNLDKFEEALVTFTHGGHALALNSGTAAIHLAMLVMGVQPGDFVICQSLTFCASANPVTYIGGVPVFVDSEPETWNMCPKALEESILACLDGSIVEKYPHLRGKVKEGRKPKAIVPVHLYGMPAKMKEIRAVADKYGIPIIEDAAEAVGSELFSKKCGTFGEIGIFSFNGNKIITTSGGGAILSKNKTYIAKAKFLATQAKENATHYEHKEVGFNYRLSNVLAGIGRGQMEVLPRRIEKRRSIFDYYKKELDGFYGISFLEEPDGYFSNRWLTCILIDPEKSNGIGRNEIINHLALDNIESRPLWKPMHLQESFAGSPYFGGNVAELLFENGICLPSGSNLDEADLERVVDKIKECIEMGLQDSAISNNIMKVG